MRERQRETERDLLCDVLHIHCPLSERSPFCKLNLCLDNLEQVLLRFQIQILLAEFRPTLAQQPPFFSLLALLPSLLRSHKLSFVRFKLLNVHPTNQRRMQIALCS